MFDMKFLIALGYFRSDCGRVTVDKVETTHGDRWRVWLDMPETLPGFPTGPVVAGMYPSAFGATWSAREALDDFDLAVQRMVWEWESYDAERVAL